MSKKAKYDTIILEFKSFSYNSCVTTMMNLKFCLSPVYEHKIRYAEIKKELQDIQGLDVFLDFEIDDSEFVYCEFYYGFRMVKTHYYDLNGIIKCVKSFVHSYSDEHEMCVFKLNYTGVLDDELSDKQTYFNDEIKNMGGNIIDEKKRIYTNPNFDLQKTFQASYSLIHPMIYDTVNNYKHAFKKGNKVYDTIISKELTIELLSNDDLVNSIINDEEFMSIIKNERNIKKINGLYFVESQKDLL